LAQILQRGAPARRDRPEAADYLAKSRWRSQPAIVNGPEKSNLRRSKEWSHCKSFNGRLRDELLNETLFTTLAQARVVLAEWRDDYNTVRPHSQLGGRTPAEIALGIPSTPEQQPQGLRL
jgi:transposase InsO family protein